METGASRLIELGVMDDLFAEIDAGEIELEGAGGLIQQSITSGFDRGLRAELTEHVGYEKGDPDAYLPRSSMPTRPPTTKEAGYDPRRQPA